MPSNGKRSQAPVSESDAPRAKRAKTSREEIPEDTFCPYCKQDIPEGLGQHIVAHKKKAPFECSVEGCFALFTSQKQLDRHAADHDGYKCTHCNKAFKSQGSLAAHVRDRVCQDREEDEEQIKCPLCGKIFKSKTTLGHHTRNRVCQEQTKDQRPKCDNCGKDFASKSTLSVHVRSRVCQEIDEDEQAGEPQHVCASCGTVFKSKITLQAHTKKRVCQEKSNDELFKCDLCGKTFVSKEGLQTHLKLRICQEKADGDRPKCDHCGKDFSTQATLQKHLKRRICQEGEEQQGRFSCDHCSMNFSDQAHLNKHIKDRVCQKPEPSCHLCGKKFNTTSGLQLHLKERVCQKTAEEKKRVRSQPVCVHCGETFANKSEASWHVLNLVCPQSRLAEEPDDANEDNAYTAYGGNVGEEDGDADKNPFGSGPQSAQTVSNRGPIGTSTFSWSDKKTEQHTVAYENTEALLFEADTVETDDEDEDILSDDLVDGIPSHYLLAPNDERLGASTFPSFTEEERQARLACFLFFWQLILTAIKRIAVEWLARPITERQGNFPITRSLTAILNNVNFDFLLKATLEGIPETTRLILGSKDLIISELLQLPRWTNAQLAEHMHYVDILGYVDPQPIFDYESYVGSANGPFGGLQRWQKYLKGPGSVGAERVTHTMLTRDPRRKVNLRGLSRHGKSPIPWMTSVIETAFMLYLGTIRDSGRRSTRSVYFVNDELYEFVELCRVGLPAAIAPGLNRTWALAQSYRWDYSSERSRCVNPNCRRPMVPVNHPWFQKRQFFSFDPTEPGAEVICNPCLAWRSNTNAWRPARTCQRDHFVRWTPRPSHCPVSGCGREFSWVYRESSYKKNPSPESDAKLKSNGTTYCHPNGSRGHWLFVCRNCAYSATKKDYKGHDNAITKLFDTTPEYTVSETGELSSFQTPESLARLLVEFARLKKQWPRRPLESPPDS